MKQNYKFNQFFKKSVLVLLTNAFFHFQIFANEKLNDEEYDKHILGKSFFTIPWVEAPSATTARDGLGPLFNANTCISCHPSNQKGTLFNQNKELSRSLIAKLSTHDGQDEPNYGGQIAINAIHGVKYEAKTKLNFEKIEIQFPDGEVDEIFKPIYKLENLQYGKLQENTNLTFRLAPTLNGLGFLDEISNKDILKNEDEFDKNSDGISGKANFVYSPLTKKIELGRYSYKASLATLKEQVANAASNDMGLTNSIYPNENCTKNQKECNEAFKGRGNFDLTDERLDAITYYLKTIKITQKKSYKKHKGYEVFKRISCNKCHIESFSLKNKKQIYPFSDLLLHDMGEGLADKVSQFKALGSEWRTTPLWGLSSFNQKKGNRLLHDGRANDFQEAILWHGGEALSVKQSYMNLKKEDRTSLLEFLGEL